jgi:hypothetical protein
MFCVPAPRNGTSCRIKVQKRGNPQWDGAYHVSRKSRRWNLVICCAPHAGLCRRRADLARGKVSADFPETGRAAVWRIVVFEDGLILKSPPRLNRFTRSAAISTARLGFIAMMIIATRRHGNTSPCGT